MAQSLGNSTAAGVAQSLPNVLGWPVTDYELLREIGRGAYGEVWLARNLTGSHVALKIVRRDTFDHDRPFEREFEGIQQFEPISRSDPSQVAILHVGRGDGFFYYVMELADDGAAEATRLSPRSETEDTQTKIDASLLTPTASSYQPKTLKRLLLERGALPADECVSIALSLTRALAHLHGSGLVHRDVKPSNVIFVRGVAKLADIGLVTSVDATRSFVGTEGYLPPEGAGTPQADLYSLGKVLYEMSTGLCHREFPKLPPQFKDSARLSALSELNEIIIKACATEPVQRYRSTAEMNADLVLLEKGESVKRKRTRQQYWSVGRKAGVVFLWLTLLTAVLFFIVHSSLNRELHSSNPDVEDLVAQGNQILTAGIPDQVSTALKYFNDATKKDQNFAPAYFGIFKVWLAQDSSRFANPPADVALKLRAAAEELMKVAPALAESWSASSWIKCSDGDLAAALAEARRATKMRAASKSGLGFAYALYGWYLMNVFDPQRGVRELLTAKDACPADPGILAQVGQAYAQLHDFPKALEYYQKSIDAQSLQTGAYELRGNLYEEKGQIPEAIQDFETWRRMAGDKETDTRGWCEQFRKAFQQGNLQGYWQKRLEEFRNGPKPNAHDVAICLVHLGRIPEAYDALAKMDKRELRDYLWSDISLDRSDSRFQELVRKTGVRK